jgi:hypothetical protein
VCTTRAARGVSWQAAWLCAQPQPALPQGTVQTVCRLLISTYQLHARCVRWGEGGRWQQPCRDVQMCAPGSRRPRQCWRLQLPPWQAEFAVAEATACACKHSLWRLIACAACSHTQHLQLGGGECCPSAAAICLRNCFLLSPGYSCILQAWLYRRQHG